MFVVQFYYAGIIANSIIAQYIADHTSWTCRPAGAKTCCGMEEMRVGNNIRCRESANGATSVINYNYLQKLNEQFQIGIPSKEQAYKVCLTPFVWADKGG